MEAEAKATAKFHAETANAVPELKAEAQRGTAARSQPMNASQKGEMLETARRVGGEQYAEGVRQEMIAMEKNKASQPHKHTAKVDPKIRAEYEAGNLRGKSSSSHVEAAGAAAEESILKGKSSFQKPAPGKGTQMMAAMDNAAGEAANAMRSRGVRVPTKAQAVRGAGIAMDGAMIAGMTAHGVEQERREAAAEGREFDPVRAAANATVRGSYEGGKHVGTEEVNASDAKGESRVWAAGRVMGRTADGLSGYSENQDKFAEEAERQRAQAEAEGRRLTFGDKVEYKTRAAVRSMPLHDMTEDILKEEMQREVDMYGENASPMRARARAAARVVPEALHTQAVFEVPFTDTEAEAKAGKMGRRVEQRRQDAVLEMDDGLHQITLIEQRMRNLDKNKNQDDPWVQQRRQELLDEYAQTRERLQRTNKVLGGDSVGEARAIREAVALLPDQPERAQRVQVDDELAQAMYDNSDSPEAIVEWKDDGYMNHGPMQEFKDDFQGYDDAGVSRAERDRNDQLVMTQTPDAIDKDDYEVHMQGMRDQKRTDDNEKMQGMRDAQDKYDAGWQATMTQVNAALDQLNKADAEKVKQKTQEAIALIQQMQSGAISDEDFTNQMSKLEDEYSGLQQQGKQAWDNILNGLMNGQVNNGQSNVSTGSTGDVGNDILASVPPSQIDQRQIVCDTKSKSGNNTPASITVDMKGGTGTATLQHEFYGVKDRIVVQVNGAAISDTGCISNKGTIQIPVSGGDQVRVVVEPACAGSSTSWNFSVSCPQQTVGGAAPSGFQNKGYQVMQNTSNAKYAPGSGHTGQDYIIKPNTSYNGNSLGTYRNGQFIK